MPSTIVKPAMRELLATNCIAAWMLFALCSSDLCGVEPTDPTHREVDPIKIDLSNNGKLETWGGASRQLSGFSGCCNPMAVAVRQDGCVVTAERGIPRVKLFSSMGEFKALIAGPEKFSSISRRETDNVVESCSSSSFAVAVDSLHRTLVLDQAAREIRVFG